ncbi:hypothetical protein INR49_019793 [Caranx melampygus]|nr:hypothetical protein INR49_019793 [Caranx melampygus]
MLVSTRGFITNMRAIRIAHGRLSVHLLSCLILLLSCTEVVARSKMASHHPHTSKLGSKLSGARHRPPTDERVADQNVQFMLSLYRSAAGPDGRPKQHRKFGSNTVRLLRPSSSSVHYLPASKDHHYTFTVQYNLDTLPSEQLIRASFIHLRSSSSPSTSTSSTTQALELPLCRAQITSLGPQTVATLEPHELWTETDITAHITGHILQRKDWGKGYT